MFGRRKKPDQNISSRRPLSTDALRATQNRAFSYHASRSEDLHNVGRTSTVLSAADERANSRRKGLRILGRRLPVIVICLVVLVFIINEFSLQSSPKIVVLGSGASKAFLQSTTVYQNAAETLFKKSTANHNKLTVNVSAITASLKQRFPELEDVSVALPIFGHQPVVYIEPSQSSFAVQTTSGIYLLDQDGTALSEAGSLQQVSALHMPLITDQSGLRPVIGRMVLPSTDISFIQTVVAQLKAQNIGIKSIVLPPAASEVDVYIAGRSFYGKFNMEEQNDALPQVGTFIAVYKALEAKNTSPSQYIDVTVDGRAYYK